MTITETIKQHDVRQETHRNQAKYNSRCGINIKITYVTNSQ